MKNKFLALTIPTAGLKEPNLKRNFEVGFYYFSFLQDDTFPSFVIFHFDKKEKLIYKIILGQAGIDKTKKMNVIRKSLMLDEPENDGHEQTDYTFSFLQMEKKHNELLSRIKTKNSNELYFSIFEKIAYYHNFLRSPDKDFIDAFFTMVASVITFDVYRFNHYSTLIINELANKAGFSQIDYFQKIQDIMNLESHVPLNFVVLYSANDVNFVNNGYAALVRTSTIYSDLSRIANFSVISTRSETKDSLENIIDTNLPNILFCVGHGDDTNGLVIKTSSGENFHITESFITERLNNRNLKTDNQVLGLFCCNANYAYNLAGVKDSLNVIHTSGYISFDTIDSFLAGFIIGYIKTGSIRHAFFMGRFTMSFTSYNYHLLQLV